MVEKTIIVEQVSNVHVNQQCSPSEDTALEQKSLGYEKRSSLTLFVPKNVDIDKILEEHPPDFHDFRDYFVYIMHLISSISAGNEKFTDDEGYVSVNKKILQKRIHKYRHYLDYLIFQRIIEEDKNYVPGERSMGLRFCKDYMSELAPVIITKGTLIKSITGVHQKMNAEKTIQVHFLRKWFNPNIQVDLEGAKTFLSNLKSQEESKGKLKAQQAYNARIFPLLELAHSEFSFGVDNTGYRLHTNLTRTMKELRKFIKYDGKVLHSVDIVNSQPFLSRPLFNENYFFKNDIPGKITNPKLLSQANFPFMLVNLIKEVEHKSDVRKYLKTVSVGNFYEDFSKVLIENDLFDGDIQDDEVRDKVKNITFASIFSPNSAIAYNPEVKMFSEIYPGVYKMIKAIKYGRKQHPAYSILLQRLEAELILDKICVRISKAYPQIPIFTIHDSIVTTEEYVPIVQNFIKKIMKQNIGVAPQLKIEKWE